jgi:predicted nucleic acid-binding protein
MRIVLDASVVMSWALHDETDARADATLALLAVNGAVATAPALWWFEVRNALLQSVRRNRLTETKLKAFLRRLGDIPIGITATSGEDAVFLLAQRHRLTFYDAAYLELALREKASLATLDDALARAAATEGVALIDA